MNRLSMRIFRGFCGSANDMLQPVRRAFYIHYLYIPMAVFVIDSGFPEAFVSYENIIPKGAENR